MPWATPAPSSTGSRLGSRLSNANAYEDTKTTTIWKNRVVDQVQNELRLELDDATQLYNIHIPIRAMGTARTIKNDVI